MTGRVKSNTCEIFSHATWSAYFQQTVNVLLEIEKQKIPHCRNNSQIKYNFMSDQ
jgi:hypothetical protein